MTTIRIAWSSKKVAKTNIDSLPADGVKAIRSRKSWPTRSHTTISFDNEKKYAAPRKRTEYKSFRFRNFILKPTVTARRYSLAMHTSRITSVFFFALLFDNTPVNMISIQAPGYREPADNDSTANSTSQKNDETSTCLSDVKVCVPVCCALGVVSRGVRCMSGGENFSGRPTPMIKYSDVNLVEQDDTTSGGEFYPVKDDSCGISWMTSSIVEDFQIFKNGSIRAPGYAGGTVVNFGKYCLLLQDSNSTKLYFARICWPWIQRGYYEIFCIIISAIIMTVIFIVYTIVPELQNLHGQMFRCYVASYIGIYICAFGVQYSTELKERAGWFTTTEITARYFAASCAFWLSVMSYNLWQSFRSLRPIRRGINTKQEERIKFTWYMICAWSSPIILFGIAALVIRYVPYFQDDIVADTLEQWGSVAIVTVTLFWNIGLYTLTSLTIKRRKAHTSDLMDGVNRHQEVDKQWLSLYLKLFLLMGGHIVIWVFWLCWTTNATTRLLATLEVAQSSFIFVVFVWKDKVKRSLYHMLGNSSATIQSRNLSSGTTLNISAVLRQ